MTEATVFLIVPCHNEARRLETGRFRSLVMRRPDVVVLFVDDGSTDETPDLLAGLASDASGRLGVLTLPVNAGKAEAVRHGLRTAIDRGAPRVAFWDADLSTPLGALDEFLDTMRARPDFEIVIGSRVQLLGRTIERRAWRHYVGRVFATAASLVLRMPVYDTQCGAKLFAVTPELCAALAEPFRARWVFDVELLARMEAIGRRHGRPLAGRVYELPLREWRDVAGSKLSAFDFAAAVPALAGIWWRYMRPDSPGVARLAEASQSARRGS